MRPPRIVNRGRIAPSSPIPVIDSGRTSFSSASAVSTIHDPDTEQNIPEEVIQKLQNSVQASSATKKLITGIIACAALLGLFGLIFGLAYSFARTTTTTTTTTTTITTTTTLVNTTLTSSPLNTTLTTKPKI